MWQAIWSTVVQEFSDIPDVEAITRISVRLTVAAVLGGLIGYERERKSRSAGVRTHMLVCVGTAVFVIGPMQAGMQINDMSRVLQGIVQGIGFLGAGAIVIGTMSQRTQGLTTAAGVWATAAVGMLAGLGLESTAVLVTIFVLIILAFLPLILNSLSQSTISVREKKLAPKQDQPDDLE
jgi:putative Mg2+ transporter-C (MgtC) family protein